MKKVKLSFLSNFTCTSLAKTMTNLGEQQGITINTYTAPYNQYTQEILNLQSGLHQFNSDLIFILLDVESFLGDFFYFSHRFNENHLKNKINELQKLLLFLQEKTQAKIILNDFMVPIYTSRGIIEDKQEFGLKEAVRKINTQLRELAKETEQLFIFDFNAFCLKIGYNQLVDPKMSYLGDLKISFQGLSKIAEEYLTYLIPLTSMNKKCLVLDLDNTLWGGIIGEDGIEGINLGPEKMGKSFLDFQKRILALHEQGIILAVNSKNNYEDAIKVIKNHPHMILKEEHFASLRINWKDKVTNMQEIAEELNIGLDSLVFLDDDETNRELVREFLPEVLVVDLPQDFSLYPKVIEDLQIFNFFSITQEDLQRGKIYLDQRKRNQLELKAPNLESFIKSLNIEVTVKDNDLSNIPRISQLTKKTNQFNLTTKRYHEEEIKFFISSDQHLVKTIFVKDKFGDQGTVGVVIINCNNNSWEIDSFLLSCRILGKTIEFAIMQDIIAEAKEVGIERIYATFIPTAKNEPIENFLERCGFDLAEQNQQEFKYVIKTYEDIRQKQLVKIQKWKP